jgi:2-oxoglutarate dehydrogenase E2 component (dihydrolipoamide succinyltransferase)
MLLFLPHLRAARAKKLQPDEVKGGTFTITNHGISGSLFATPIINQPQWLQT